MSSSFGNSANPTVRDDKAQDPNSPVNIIKRMSRSRSVFEGIADYPPAGTCERFEDSWYKCLAFTELRVMRCKKDIEAFEREVEEGKKIEISDEALWAEYVELMEALKNALLQNGQLYSGLRTMSQAPPPSPRGIDSYRTFVSGKDPHGRAPNGRHTREYGLADETPRRSLCAVVNEVVSPIDNFLMDHVMDPFMEYIYRSMKKNWRKMRQWRIGARTLEDPGDSKEDEEDYVDGRKIGVIAKIAASMLAILSLAAAIGILNILHGFETRVIVMTVFGLGFCLCANFVTGPEALPMFNLSTSFFQVMAVFVAVSSGR
ncbi:hypothetical protein P154DRAFT_277281 [Amniculicola lignicola CBS 123094]|uniref:DUF6594 domain-containing protein n=1 Tax=Amniculicola lignicola CBS 123094 TaxID=1392246 RepID=A0A6A5W6U5_9PLEO|nr:hypothetical protein P154DRAFT_277281 [Amniculicola lignicola CBS 123094]